jgi:NAD(P)-dependent dehydrogenase (short-subunit alcohol dehydrogenase family)
MQSLDLTGKTILITGGAGAIGQVVVTTLAQQGARVAVVDVLPTDAGMALLATLDVPADHLDYYQASAADPTAMTQAFDHVCARWEMPHIVCCHAGMVDAYPVQEYPLARFDLLMEVNLRGAFVTAQCAAQRWLAAGSQGHLIFTTSWVQDVPWPEITPYTASKAGMKALMRGFARELAARGIRANAIAPGIVGVGLAKRQWESDPVYRARAQKAIPLGTMQPPESVANTFLFLCSDLAAYMTGAVLVVDGGCSLYPMDE